MNYIYILHYAKIQIFCGSHLMYGSTKHLAEKIVQMILYQKQKAKFLVTCRCRNTSSDLRWYIQISFLLIRNNTIQFYFLFLKIVYTLNLLTSITKSEMKCLLMRVLFLFQTSYL